MKTTKKKTVNIKAKIADKYAQGYNEGAYDALESAQQIKSWNKYGSTDFSYVYVFMAGIILGLAIACIVVTPSIIEAIN